MRNSLVILLSFSLFLQVNSQVVINEFLSGNIGGIVDEDGDLNDWIELYNAGANTLDISSWSLSDDLAEPAKWRLPELQLETQGHVLIFASGKDRMNIDLSYITLIDWGDQWNYHVPTTEIGDDWKMPGFDAAAWSIGSSGFGYSDDDDATPLNTTLSVYIRKEFVLENVSDIKRVFLDIDYDDAFIAYINGVEIARNNLGVTGSDVAFDRTADGNHEALMYLGNSPERYEISDLSMLVEGTNVLAVEGHNISLGSSDLSLIPFLTIGSLAGDDQVSEHLFYSLVSGLHTNFKIKGSGESIYLFDAAGVLVDSTGALALPMDISYGRKPDGTESFVYFAEPTPGKINNTLGATSAEANQVIYSQNGGKHLGGTTVSLSSVDPSDPVYYTLDGSIPNSSSTLYTEAISLSGNGVIRARVIKPGVLPGPVATNTYVTQYDHQIPVVCISTHPDNLWSDEKGIYILGPDYNSSMPHLGANYWEEWERPVHLEMYETNGTKVIDQGAGAKIMGGWSRTHDQKSMALFARSDYGKGSFEYQFFKEKEIEEFEAIVLRNSGNDNMRLQFHDAFMTGLTRNMNIDRQAAQPAAFYMNGEYWGILNIREKVNEHFIAGNHNVNTDEINLLEREGGIIYGSNEQYLGILDFLDGHSSLANDDDYAVLSDQIDIDNYIQYQLSQIYLNNQDWPGNNIKYWNTNTGGDFRWILYDTDFGFMDYEVGENTLAFALSPNGPSWPNPPWSTLLFRRMISNQSFRHEFINQFCDRLNVDFRPERVRADLDSLKGVYYDDMQYHFNRWWGSYAQWEADIASRKQFANSRPLHVRNHMQDEFNLGSQLPVNLDVSEEAAGKILLNTVYPHEYPFTGIYFKDIPIQLKAIPKPGYKFVRWEGTKNSTELVIDYDMAGNASFTAIFEEASVEDLSVVINEINYSSSMDWDTKDWVEFVNNGKTSVDMEGWLFSDSGPDTGFYFPNGTVLPPGQYVVVCRNHKEFKSLNPGVSNVIGDFSFGLSSSGDNLRLYDQEGNVIDAVNYSPYTPWPSTALGTGNTIELIDPSLDNMQGENWKGITYKGTPGTHNSGYDNLEPVVQPDMLTDFECFPNPFIDFTTISFSIAKEGNYRLEVFDMKGQLVEVLVDEYLIPDNYSVDWHGDSSFGEQGSGVYTIRLSSESQFETIRLIMMK